jgi:hypothetical protein
MHIKLKINFSNGQKTPHLSSALLLSSHVPSHDILCVCVSSCGFLLSLHHANNIINEFISVYYLFQVLTTVHCCDIFFRTQQQFRAAMTSCTVVRSVDNMRKREWNAKNPRNCGNMTRQEATGARGKTSYNNLPGPCMCNFTFPAIPGKDIKTNITTRNYWFCTLEFVQNQ